MLIELMDKRVGDDFGVYHLRDVPANAVWSRTNTLVTPADRAIVIVAFGTLSAVNLSINCGHPTSLRIAIELLRLVDMDKLHMITCLADSRRRANMLTFH